MSRGRRSWRASGAGCLRFASRPPCSRGRGRRAHGAVHGRARLPRPRAVRDARAAPIHVDARLGNRHGYRRQRSGFGLVQAKRRMLARFGARKPHCVPGTTGAVRDGRRAEGPVRWNRRGTPPTTLSVARWTEQMTRMRFCQCCYADIHLIRNAEYADLPFCRRCVSEKCNNCRRWVRAAKSLQNSRLTGRPPTERRPIGRPRGPRMACGWGCGIALSGHEMRAHFTGCPKRPAFPGHVDRPSSLVAASLRRPGVRRGSAAAKSDYGGRLRRPLRNGTERSKAKRGRPPGRRMPCGWGCGSQLTASHMRTHFTDCRNGPAINVCHSAWGAGRRQTEI